MSTDTCDDHRSQSPCPVTATTAAQGDPRLGVTGRAAGLGTSGLEHPAIVHDVVRQLAGVSHCLIAYMARR